MLSLKTLLPGLLASVLVFVLKADLTPAPCSGDDSVQVGSSRVRVCSIFSESYLQAREKFRSLARKYGTVESLPIYQDLTTDIVVLNGNAPGLVVHTSGVHGVEGFAGSAVQLSFLKALETYDKRPTVILVHAVNPYGMSFYRRFNENNVDLNRNALTEDEWNSFAGPSHYNKGAYSSFDALFNPDYAPTKLDAFLVFWVKAVNAIRMHGIPKLKAALVGGQYYNENGIIYGGKRLEKSISALEEWVDGYKNSSNYDEADEVTWIDLHTGLGKSGEDTILAELDPTQDDSQIAKWFPDSHSTSNSQNGKDVNAGYEQVRGSVTAYFCRKFANAFCFTQEFGTAHNVAVAHAMILENAAHQHHSSEEALQWAQQTTRRAFYKPNAKWRASVVERGISVLEQAMNRSMNLSEISRSS